MDKHTHSTDPQPAEQEMGWRRWRQRQGGRFLLGLGVAGLGGFWLVNNLTNNLALLADNPGRAVVPALVILAGIAAMFVRRDR